MFIKRVDALSELIDSNAELLFHRMQSLPVGDLGLPEVPLNYYLARHHQRNFFSVQTAAELLYRALKHKGKPHTEVVLMEYGAGLGSLFLLAKMINCKAVIYNDILADMVEAAKIISHYFKVPIDHFFAGGHEETLEQLRQEKLECDIIISRNVLEHIYDLHGFFADMYAQQPGALIYFSTTANPRNPAMWLFHRLLHRRHEKQYLPLRRALIQKKAPDLDAVSRERLAKATRGLAMADLDKAIMQFQSAGTLPDPGKQYSNTCDPENGNWAEHLLPLQDYKAIVEGKGYKLTILPAFWDSHYQSRVKNVFTRTLNRLIGYSGARTGLVLAPFIYIIAEKKS